MKAVACVAVVVDFLWGEMVVLVWSFVLPSNLGVRCFDGEICEMLQSCGVEFHTKGYRILK